MPLVSIWAVRIALIYLVAGAVIGSLMLAAKGVALPGWLHLLRAAHIDMLVFGFMVQFAFGVAHWILPRTPARTSAAAVVGALLLLNAGVLLVSASQAVGELPLLGGRLAQLAAVCTFMASVWPRVRAVRPAP